MKRTACLLATCLTLPLASLAALPTGKITFVQPTGTVAADESIEVRVRLTLDDTSAPLTFSSNPLSGFDLADLPTQGYYINSSGQQVYADFASYTGAYLNTVYWCGGNFTNTTNCGDAEYRFEFWLNDAPLNPSINFRDHFTLAAGDSFDYLFGTFIPKAGGAAAGNYTFYNTSVYLEVEGLDAAGNRLTIQAATLAESCPSQDPGCAFTRSVLAVPEPGTYGLMGAGLLLVAWRRRQTR